VRCVPVSHVGFPASRFLYARPAGNGKADLHRRARRSSSPGRPPLSCRCSVHLMRKDAAVDNGDPGGRKGSGPYENNRYWFTSLPWASSTITSPRSRARMSSSITERSPTIIQTRLPESNALADTSIISGRCTWRTLAA